MLSLAWLTVFIIFVYVPGSTLDAIESSSSVLLSGSGLEANSGSSVTLEASSLVRGDDLPNEKQFLNKNKTGETNDITIPTDSHTTTTTKTITTTRPALVSDDTHSITKDSSQSPSPSSSSSLGLLKFQLKQAIAATYTPTTTSTTTAALITTRTATQIPARAWNILNDIRDRNNNGLSSYNDYGHTSTSQHRKQKQQQQLSQLALSATQSTSVTNTTPFPMQLTEAIQNTARVIIRGNNLNRGYIGLASSESASSFALGRAEVATRPPLAATSSASFVLSLSEATSSSVMPTTSSTTSTTTSATTSSRTTASTTTTLSPSLSSLDGYLNITSQAGTHAYLPCNVKQLVKKPISWLRVRDGHILTVDQTTFIADQRFQSIYSPNPERWSLQIKYVQTKDAGTYECQVSTEPKTSAIVSLNIVEPKTELIGESNRHVKAGSQVKLRCIISQALEPPLFINWYHNRKQIYLHNRKGWRTEIERDAAENTTTDKQSTIASLIIPSVSKKDSGNYTCSPSNSEPITVVLHVLNGEYSASAITSGSNRSSRCNSGSDGISHLLYTILWVISFLICFGQLRHHQSRLLPHDIIRE